MSTPTRLLRSIGYPTASGAFEGGTVDHSPSLLKCAERNKVRALYEHRMAALGEPVADTEATESSLETFDRMRSSMVRGARALSDTGILFSVVKSPTTFPADFADADFLVAHDDLGRAKSALLEAGFEQLGDAPSGPDYRDPETGEELDVQTDFALRRVVYLSGRLVLEQSSPDTVRGVDIRSPTTPMQACLFIVHSVTEQLFLLRDFYHLLWLFESMSWKDVATFDTLVDRAGLRSSVRAVLPLVARLAEHVFDRTPETLDQVVDHYGSFGEFDVLTEDWHTPYRYRGRTVLRSLAGKLYDPVFRRTAVSQLSEFRKPRIVWYSIRYLAERQRRETY